MKLYCVILLFVTLTFSRAIAGPQWLSPVEGWVPFDVKSGNFLDVFRGDIAIGQFIRCDIGAQQRYTDSDWLPLATIMLSETGDLRRENSDAVYLKLSAVFDEGKTGREYVISTHGMEDSIQSAFMKVSDPKERIQITMFWEEGSEFLFSAEEAGEDPTIKKIELSDFRPKVFAVSISGLKGFVR